MRSRDADPDKRLLDAGAQSVPRELDAIIRIARGVIDAPIGILFGFEGEVARNVAFQSDISAHELAGMTVPARRLRLDRTRVVPAVGRGPAAPEVAVFPASIRVASLVTLPVFDELGAQWGALVVADTTSRTEFSDRRVRALEELAKMIPGIVRATDSSVFDTEPGGTPSPLSTAPGQLQRSGDRPLPRNTSRPPGGRQSLVALRAVDIVTGLPDRAFIEAETERLMERASVLQLPLTMMLVSLDRFRRVNDSLGHAVGDQLLRQVGERLRSSVGEGDLVGRRSGDEFIVVIEDLGPSSSPLPLADRIQQGIREPYFIEGNELVVTASVGIARFPDDGLDPPALLRHADIALHRAKESGPGRLAIFDDAMRASAEETLQIERELREALRLGQLMLYYQPKYAIDDRRVIGAEALMRWKHPERGMVSPGRFIPVAEETGLVVPMGTWALIEVCRQRKRWQDAGLPVGRVSVNVSGLQFQRLDFVGTVTRALKSASLDPELLELELTETIIMSDADGATDKLSELRRLGVHVSVDDFGTGYSSLAYLQKLPVDVLKIDRSFVQDLDTEGLKGEQARALAQAITFLGHQLGLEVLAEGVETPGQLEQLAMVGCDGVQGYIFGRPIPPAEFELHIRK